MLRNVVLIIGCILAFVHHYVITIRMDAQFAIFFTGIVLLGVPHGAADLLVAARTADSDKKYFSKFRFFKVYISRLLLFFGFLLVFPIAGVLLFILFASYHFGETDLCQFNTNTISGKLFVFSYGLLILSIILLHHVEEVTPLIQLFDPQNRSEPTIIWIALNRYLLLSGIGILFFCLTFIYFLVNPDTPVQENGQFLIRFAVILFIVFTSPLLLGFTFYFVVWHSVISLQSIISYLRINKSFSRNFIIRQMSLYSFLAIVGIGLVGISLFMLGTRDAATGYVFMGLAVLTAPHLQIMHDMYYHLRKEKLS